MRICVFGAGSVGGYLAGYLSHGGAEVSAVARGARLQATFDPVEPGPYDRGEAIDDDPVATRAPVVVVPSMNADMLAAPAVERNLETLRADGRIIVDGVPSFEAAEWEMTLAPSARGTGVFLDAARLLGSFAFGSVGTHRLESRVALQNGRANGALNKLGAVQEGILRRSVRRCGAYHDQVLWSMLEDDWSDHWVTTASRVH